MRQGDRQAARRAARRRSKGAALERLRFQHPLYDRDSLGVLGDYVTLDAGTGAVHTAPGHGADDFTTGVSTASTSTRRRPGGHFIDDVELFAGLQVFDANPKVEAALQERGRLWHRDDVRALSIRTAGAATTRSSSSPRRSGSSRMDANRGACGRARARRRSIQRRAVDSGVGPGAHPQHDRQPARLVHLAPARLGRADPGVRLHDVRRAVLDAGARRAGRGGLRRRTAPTPGTSGRSRSSCPTGSRARRAAAPTFERETNILDVWFDSGSSHEAVLPVRAGADAGRRTSTSKAATSTAAGSRARCSSASARAARAPYRAGAHARLRRRRRRPQDVEVARQHDRAAGRHQAERRRVLRLWVAMVDYREEIRARQGDPGPRRSRPTARSATRCAYLVGNLYDFDPAARRGADVERLEEVDRYVLARYAELASKIAARPTTRYDFQADLPGAERVRHRRPERVLRRRVKDRLYTFGAGVATRAARRRPRCT